MNLTRHLTHLAKNTTFHPSQHRSIQFNSLISSYFRQLSTIKKRARPLTSNLQRQQASETSTPPRPAFGKASLNPHVQSVGKNLEETAMADILTELPVTIKNTLKSGTHEDMLQQIEIMLLKAISINPNIFYKNSQKYLEGFVNALIPIRTSFSKAQIRTLLHIFDKYSLLSHPEVASLTKHLLKDLPLKTFNDIYVALFVGVPVTFNVFADVITNAKSSVESQAVVLYRIMSHLYKSDLGRFENYQRNLVKTPQTSLSDEDLESLKKICLDIQSLISEQIFAKRIEGLLTNLGYVSSENLKKTRGFLLKTHKNKPVLKETDPTVTEMVDKCEDILIEFALRYKGYGNMSQFVLTDLFSIMKVYIDSKVLADPIQKLKAHHMSLVLDYVFQKLTDVRLVNAELEEIEPQLLLYYKYHELSTNNPFLSSSQEEDKSPVSSDPTQVTQETDSKYTSANLNSFEKKFVDYLNEQPITKTYIEVFQTFMKVLSRRKLSSKTFLDICEDVLITKALPHINDRQAIQFSFSLVRSSTGRGFVQQTLRNILEQNPALRIADQIKVCYLMAHSNIVYSGIYKNFEKNFELYVEDTSTGIKDLVMLFYMLSKIKEGSPKLWTRLASEIENASVDDIGKEKLIPYIWACINNEMYLNNLKEVINSVVGTLTQTSVLQVAHFAESFYALKEMAPILFAKFGLQSYEKNLRSMLEVNGIKSMEENVFGKRSWNSTSSASIMKIKRTFPNILENIWIDGYFVDLYIPAEKLGIDLYDLYNTKQDNDELIGSVETKKRVMKSKAEKGGIKYVTMTVEEQRMFIDGRLELEEILQRKSAKKEGDQEVGLNE